MGSYLIKDSQVAKKKLGKQQGKSKIFNTARSALCLLLLIDTNTFKSNQAKRVFKIYHTITWIIYILECILCTLHYVDKSETSLILD